MREKHQNILFYLAITFLALAFVASGALTSPPVTEYPIGLFIAWLICNSRKRNAIGGWLLFYYIQLFAGAVLLISLVIGISLGNLNIANFGIETMQYLTHTMLFIPNSSIILIVELVFGSMLLFKKYRNRKIYNLLRITLATSFVFGTPISALWLLYFTFSKRVKMVFIENKWNPDILHPIPQYNPCRDNPPSKCNTCNNPITSLDYKCPNCGKTLWKTEEDYLGYNKINHRNLL